MRIPVVRLSAERVVAALAPTAILDNPLWSLGEEVGDELELFFPQNSVILAYNSNVVDQELTTFMFGSSLCTIDADTSIQYLVQPGELVSVTGRFIYV